MPQEKIELDASFTSATAQLESEESFLALIHSATVRSLSLTNPAACANLMASAYRNIAAEKKPAIAHYLLNGNFTRSLSHKSPTAYANFILNIVGGMSPDDSQKFAKSVTINPRKDTEHLHLLMTDNPLPPIVTIQEYGELIAMPITAKLQTRMPSGSYNKVRELIAQHARCSPQEDWKRLLLHTSYRMTPV